MYQEGASCFFIQTNRFHSGRRKKHGQLASIVVVRKECREEILRPGSSTLFHYFPSDRTFARQNGTGHGTNCGKHRRRASCRTRNVEAIESPKRQRKRAAHHRLLNNEPIFGNREALFSLNRYQPMIRFFFFIFITYLYEFVGIHSGLYT